MCSKLPCSEQYPATISHHFSGCGDKDDRYAWDANLANRTNDAEISVFAIEDGVVLEPTFNGNGLRLRHNNVNGDWYSAYDNISIAEGIHEDDVVQQGQLLGIIRMNSHPHLHFGVYYRIEEDPTADWASVNRTINPSYQNPLSGEVYELGDVNGIVSGSIVSSANVQVRRAGGWHNVARTDENGRFRITSIPALRAGDSLRIVANGYEPLAVAIDEAGVLGNRISIPMLNSLTSTGVTNARVRVVNNTAYFTDPEIELIVSGTGYSSYDIVGIKHSEEDFGLVPLSQDHPATQATVNVTLSQIGRNTVGVLFKGLDSVLVVAELEYDPAGSSFSLQIESDSSSVGADIYADSRFIRTISNESESLSFLSGTHEVLVTKLGYRDTTFLVDSSAVVSLNLIPILLTQTSNCDSTVIDFATHGSVQYRNAVSFRDSAHASVISFRRCYDQFNNLGIEPQSDRFDLHRLSSSWSPLLFVAALDQVERLDTDSIYLLTIRDDTTFQKNLFGIQASLLMFDSAAQKLSCSHLGTSSTSVFEESVVIARRKAPMLAGLFDIEVALGETLDIPIASFFLDPDSLDGDMQVTVEGTENGLVASVEGDSIVISVSGSSGQLLLTLRAMHDGLERIAVINVLAVAPTVSLSPKVLLDGPLDLITGLLSDSLRVSGLVPLSEPYTGLGYVHHGGGGEATSSATLAISGPNAIVDWVIVELREAGNASHIVQTRSALLQRDGDVTSSDGTSPVVFSVSAGVYHVAIRHRNHLGVMSLEALPLSNSATLVDFTSSAFPTYGSDARKSSPGLMSLWAGNTLWDGGLKYTGMDNDRDPVLVRIGGTVPTNTIPGYYVEDVNLDGVVKYTGSGNDRDPILVNIGGTVPTQVRSEQLP
jgi:hypothetical protein